MEKLVSKIEKASQIINNNSRYGNGNHIILSNNFYQVYQKFLIYEKRKKNIDKLLKSDS